MTLDCRELPHPLLRDGTSQPSRVPDALDPTRTLIDGRSFEELLAWARGYAAQLVYYGPDDRPDGDWQALVAHDVSVIIAAIRLSQAPARYRTRLEQARAKAEAAVDLAGKRAVFAEIAQVVINLAVEVDSWHGGRIADLRMSRDVSNAIRSELRPAIKKVKGYVLGAETKFGEALNLDFSVLSRIWDLEDVEPDKSIFTAKSDLLAMDRAIHQFDGLFEAMHRVLLRLVNDSAGWMEETLRRWPRHQPHMALLLAFFEIYGKVQGEINGLTAKHLDFYYRRVLGLSPRPAQPDRVHILAELAAKSALHRLEKDTAFKAGKDRSGVERIYTLEEDSDFNRAKVAELRALYIDRAEVSRPGTAEAVTVTRFHVSTRADSFDGAGADFPDPAETRWKTFGQDGTRAQYRPGLALASPMLFLAEGTRRVTVTFQLDRKVGIAIAAGQDLFAAELSTPEGWITVTRETTAWTQGMPEPLATRLVLGKNGPRSAVEVTIALPPTFPAIAPLGEEAEGARYEASLPALRLTLSRETSDQGDEVWPFYSALAEIPPPAGGPPTAKPSACRIERIDIATEVQGLRDLVLRSGQAPLAPDQPGLAFGATPGKGSSFYLGSWEAFQKSLARLTLHLDWLELPDLAKLSIGYGVENDGTKKSGVTYPTEIPAAKSPVSVIFEGVDNASATAGSPWKTVVNGAQTTTVHLLEDRDWQPLAQKVPVFADALVRTEGTDSGKAEVVPKQSGKQVEPTIFTERQHDLARFTAYDRSLPRGFLRFDLDDDFGHTDYTAAYTKVAICLATNNTPANCAPLPFAAYTPTLKEISLDYLARASWKPGEADAPERLFHLHPFGYAAAEGGTPSLLPVFEVNERRPEKAERVKPMSGALYIGVEQAEPPQSLSLLVQVAEGSADPRVLELPWVTWSYLAGDRWLDFAPDEILADGTRGLIRSGLVRLKIPKVADRAHKRMPGPARVWLRAAISGPPNGLCDMVGLHAQAARAVFSDRGNDPDHAAIALEAGSIKKLAQRDSAIAALDQPYASFGGSTKERSSAFYRRVSERLRHKDRAITIWDYERLVLEHFPEVYKAKCLSHTGRLALVPDQAADGAEVDSEALPGAVTVVVVANVRNRNEANPREPLASTALLDRIQEWLRQRVSPAIAASVRVVNPDYERIGTAFDVVFRAEEDPGYRLTTLKSDIIRFLSPWAYENEHEISFGGRIHGSMLVNFIERRDYVDVVRDFQLFRNDPGFEEPLEQVAAASARSILVAAAEHNIRPVP